GRLALRAARPLPRVRAAAPPGRPGRTAGRGAVRRRTADGGRRAGAHVPAAGARGGRAVARAGPQHHRRPGRASGPAQPRTGPRGAAHRAERAARVRAVHPRVRARIRPGAGRGAVRRAGRRPAGGQRLPGRGDHMSAFLTYLLNGLAVGCAIALIASGLVAIYRVTGVVNFAQGTFAVVAGLCTSSLLGLGLPHGISEVTAVLLAVVAGLLTGLAAIGKLGTTPLSSLIITLGEGVQAYAVDIVLRRDQPSSAPGLAGAVEIVIG